MDEKVLAAQRWVNITYGNVSGYRRCPEDGVTGWATIHSLIRALQIELGVTPLSDNFGPATLSKLSALGDIRPGSPHTNIVRIIQHGLVCKGYSGSPQNGDYDIPTTTSIQRLKSNMGLDPTGWVQPKVFKAILTMDAYTLLAGGTEKVRSVQRWLNGSYINRANFFVIPCDGVFSRDVQRALYLAIQFELGMTDDQATGVFGPGTRAGLKSHPISLGSSGIWVQIFSAAGVFNGKARFRGVNGAFEYREATFTASFDAGLTGYVKAFQEFSELPANGNVDFATWCQALVSTGDPDRPGTAADCITTVTDARAQALKAAGYKVVGRYLDERPSGNPLNKQIQPGELNTIFRNGLLMFPISQYYAGSVGYFTHSQGYKDAVDAHAAAVKHGFNTGTVIYFAVDYDATREEIESHIEPYFKGVVGGLASQGKKYVHGVYGSRNICAQVTKSTYARWSFVSGMSTGFSGNMGFALPDNWSFNQIQTLTVGSGGGEIQIDKSVHKSGTDPGVSSVNDPSSPVDIFVSYVRRLYDLATGYGGSRPKSQLVMEFLRHEDYDNHQWLQLIGDVDDGFIRYVKNSGIKMVREFRDPFYGIDIKVSHLGATCNGIYLNPPLPHPAVNECNGDVAGWGGDLMTFYGEWRRDSGSHSSGYTYCMEKLAKLDAAGTFKLRDLIEDADGHNIAMMVRANKNIVEAVEAYYASGDHLSRFRQFYSDRFQDAIKGKKLVERILTNDIYPIISAGRLRLIQSTGGIPTIMPSMLPAGKLDEFIQGFMDTLLARVRQEGIRTRGSRGEDKI